MRGSASSPCRSRGRRRFLRSWSSRDFSEGPKRVAVGLAVGEDTHEVIARHRRIHPPVDDPGCHVRGSAGNLVGVGVPTIFAPYLVCVHKFILACLDGDGRLLLVFLLGQFVIIKQGAETVRRGRKVERSRCRRDRLLSGEVTAQPAHDGLVCNLNDRSPAERLGASISLV